MIKKLLTIFFLFISFAGVAQLLTWTPEFATQSTSGMVITVDATKGNFGLLNHNADDVYVHIGVITNLSTGAGDWKHVQTTWGNTDLAAKATSLGNNKWSFTISKTLNEYFQLTPGETIQKIAILFRSGDGNEKQTNIGGSDMYIPVYTSAAAVRFTQPPMQPLYIPAPETITKSVGDNIQITAIANNASAMKIYLNGTVIQTATGATTISANPTITSSGNQTIVAEANDGITTATQTITFFATGNVNIAPLPAGVQQGINYINNTTATLVLYAPGKGRVAVIGDLPGNNWTEQSSFQMNKTPDGNYWWITLSGLTPGTEYSFQYLVNGTLRIADPYAELIQDPYNDQYISSSTYPGMKPYPSANTSEVVSILQTAKPQYNWDAAYSYSRPDKRNLVIYELLVRDFVAKHDWVTLRDTLNYLKKLGINAIEIMPFNEFEGNISWGYNPDFYFAPDKYYGPANTLKEFIDSCHKNGIAVVMDIALNHSFGMSPMVRLYWDAANNRPAADNPWFNPVAKHAFNVGYDMNHESPQTKYFVSRVLSYWLSEYKIDGFRFDLSKGFTQTQTCDNNGNNCNVGAWSAYDQSRIDIWKAYYDTLQKYGSGSYCILEHFADNSEETVLSNYGMMLWGNLNYNYNQATMGYATDWNFNWGIASVRGWSNPNLVTYMESHDEERLMYKNLQYGNTFGGTPSYNIKVLDTALQRQQLAAAFFLTIPGPKMIWQFGELGYDYSINYCQDGSINSNCRTDPKPIRWDYYQDAKRRKLFNTYSHLIRLRNNPAFTPAFTSNAIQQDFSGAFKWLILNSAAGKVVVIGNFDVTAKNGSVTFPTAGTWYDYLNGNTITATGASQSFLLKAGEFRVFTNVQVPLPVTLLNFTALHQNGRNILEWKVATEKNVAYYEVERSANGTSFENIGKVLAEGNTTYQFTDKNPLSESVVYYRIKTVDLDESYTFSEIRAVKQSFQNFEVSIRENPVSNELKLAIQSAVTGKVHISISGVEGKPLITKRVDVSSGSNMFLLNEVSRLSKGIYFVKTMMNGESVINKVVKL